MENDDVKTEDTSQEASILQERRFPRSYFMPKPVKLGDEMDVSISEVSHKGDGLIRINGYVIFIPNSKKGDNIKIKITQIRPNHAIAEIK